MMKHENRKSKRCAWLPQNKTSWGIFIKPYKLALTVRFPLPIEDNDALWTSSQEKIVVERVKDPTVVLVVDLFGSSDSTV